MGTSNQLDIGSPDAKRSVTLHSKGHPEKVVSISDNWKSKNTVKDCRFHNFSSHQRLFEPASNVDRTKEDGCMNKLKIERSIKLRQEEFKGRKKYDIVSGVEQKDEAWIGSFGDQISGPSPMGFKSARSISVVTHDDQKAHWASLMNRKTTIC